MNTRKKLFSIAAVVAVSALWYACEPNEDNPLEQEVITSVKLEFTEMVSGDVSSFEYSDPDGEGGNAPTIQTIQLEAAKTYQVSINLYNESATPVDTITHEIEEHGEEHQFFFNTTGVSINVNITDMDVNNLPVGLESFWTTGAANSGTMRVTLKHLDGVAKDGNINTGETDIQIDFPISIN